ncbi:hypothetical protein [Roseibium sp.]|uniref:hypothetical protein n=1 Tax=Roseibium sp. TaxID=1936156 RepID=UPI003BAE575C
MLKSVSIFLSFYIFSSLWISIGFASNLECLAEAKTYVFTLESKKFKVLESDEEDKVTKKLINCLSSKDEKVSNQESIIHYDEDQIFKIVDLFLKNSLNPYNESSKSLLPKKHIDIPSHPLDGVLMNCVIRGGRLECSPMLWTEPLGLEIPWTEPLGPEMPVILIDPNSSQ